MTLKSPDSGYLVLLPRSVNSMFKSSATDLPNIPQALLFCVLPLVAFAVAGYPLSGWIVDDAGISFAYARNLADGAGFVSQPGKAPVEGFSNPLWTLLFVPSFWLSSSIPLWSAKILGHLFSFGVFFFGFQIVLRITRSSLFGLLAMTFLALNTSFVVWNVSGLENSLYAFEIITIAYLGLLTLDRLSWRVAVAAGILAAGAALTRPEGAIFAVLWPSALLVRSVRDWTLSPAVIRSGVAYGVAAAVPYIAYKAMALMYFGSLVPNTYHAKGAPGLDRLSAILRLDGEFTDHAVDLLTGLFGFAWLSFGVFVVTLVVCLVAKRAVAALVYLSGATGLAYFAFLFLPPDWMAEFRFGTPFLVLFYPTLFSLIWVAAGLLPKASFLTKQFPAFLIVALLAVPAILVHQIRLDRFYDDPTVSIDWVSNRYAKRFNRVAETLGVENGSFLLPDLGGSLLDSELELFDIAGLVDARIARTLWTDKAALREYIFNEVKPTFILTYAYSTLATDLDASPQFREQYIPLRESEDQIATELSGRTMYSGAYVRKDVVEGRPEALARARALLSDAP